MKKEELRDIADYLSKGITEIQIRYNTNNHTFELLRACKMLENYSLNVKMNLRLSNIKLSLNLNNETDKDLIRVVSATDWIGEFLPNYREEIEYSIKMQSQNCSSERTNKQPTFDNSIFKSEMGHKIFNEWLSEYKDSKYITADFSFIYRKLEYYLQPWQRPEVFRNETLPKYGIEIPDRIKKLDECSTDKKNRDFNRIVQSLK